jgi:hypothetical protein
MGRNSLGHRDVQGIDDGWDCATRGTIVTNLLKIGPKYLESGKAEMYRKVFALSTPFMRS